MKASRLLSILMLLQSRGRLTAGVLARTLEVSERTILRDIDQLSAAGVPLWGERGWQGGFQLQPGWSTQLTGMTEAESQALLLAGLPAAAAELGLGEAAVSARLKLVASLPLPWREQAARVAERLHIDPLDWYRREDSPAFLREAAEAVWHARRLRVRYRSWRGVSSRELEPLGLVLKAGAWYLVARRTGQDAVRTYRLTGMEALALGGGSFRRPRCFDLAAQWQASAREFERTLAPLEAHLLASPRALGWLVQTRERFTLQSAADEPLADGWQAIVLPIESLEHGARRVLGFGGEMQVQAPPALRTLVAQMALRLSALHDAPKTPKTPALKPSRPSRAAKPAPSAPPRRR